MRIQSLTLFVVALLAAPAAAQSGFSVEATAGLSFPTEADFSDGYETGLQLGARAGYAVSDNIKATVGVQFNRYSSKDTFVDESAAAKAAGPSGVQGFDPNVTYNLFGIRGGIQYGARMNDNVGYFAGVEAGPTSQQAKSDFGDSDAEWDLTAGVYGGGRYYFTPTSSVSFGPAFNMIFAEETYHFLDIIVGVAFDL